VRCWRFGRGENGAARGNHHEKLLARPFIAPTVGAHLEISPGTPVTFRSTPGRRGRAGISIDLPKRSESFPGGFSDRRKKTVRWPAQTAQTG